MIELDFIVKEPIILVREFPGYTLEMILLTGDMYHFKEKIEVGISFKVPTEKEIKAEMNTRQYRAERHGLSALQRT